MRSHEGEGPKQFKVGFRGYRRDTVDEYVELANLYRGAAGYEAIVDSLLRAPIAHGGGPA